MLKEKITQIFKNDGNNKKKIENLVFFLIVLVITVIVINIIWKEDKKEVLPQEENSKQLVSQEIQKDADSLEEKLKDILSNINGVGNVDVLITYNETEELIPVYNTKDKKSITNEVDAEGGTRIIEETDSSQEVIYQDSQIITKKMVSPKIEGAIVTAEGGGNSNVKSNIIQAIEAVTGLATHRIQVFEKKN